jgi:hypothetical protein
MATTTVTASGVPTAQLAFTPANGEILDRHCRPTGAPAGDQRRTQQRWLR